MLKPASRQLEKIQLPLKNGFSLTIQNIHWVNFTAVLLKDHEKN
jgi:hypothetical protein